jgi:hypothetical protein
MNPTRTVDIGFALSCSTSCCPAGRLGTFVSIILVRALIPASPASHTNVKKKISRFIIVLMSLIICCHAGGETVLGMFIVASAHHFPNALQRYKVFSIPPNF